MTRRPEFTSMFDHDAVPRWCESCGTYHHGETHPWTEEDLEPEDFGGEDDDE